jgi:RTX calcium-binding nonapeptide repeat (4 copies)
MRGGGCAVVRRGHLIAVVSTFLIGCAVLLLVVGCAGTSSETSKKEQGSSPKATSEEARCEGTRTTVRHGFHRRREDFLTNDLPGCPKGGLVSGTEGSDNLAGKVGEDEIRGLGERDFLIGGAGNDVLHGGPGNDLWLFGGAGDDVIYGGDGDDSLLDDPGDDVVYGGDGSDSFEEILGANVFYGGDGNDFVWVGLKDGQKDKFYCGKGKDEYLVGEFNAAQVEHIDYMDSCEKKAKMGKPMI